jgi:hypothetical protein
MNMDSSSILPEEHDAQRAMEQKSLRNVRSLLDKLESEEALERRTRRRIGWALVVVTVVAVAGGYAWIESRHHRGELITLTPGR